MKLSKILKDFPRIKVKGGKEIELTGISSHSKSVSPGNLFVAKRGSLHDGARFIPDAIASGAKAILTEVYDPTLDVTQLICPDVSQMEGALSKVIYEDPSSKLFCVGITGTNGKTTTSYFIKQLLDKFKGPCGLIGTIEYIIADHRYPPTHTTPDVATNHRLLREMVQVGCQSCVMEVTSHALEQSRVYGIEYDVAIFTNLTQDHLDYHKTMQTYADAKSKLFSSLNPEAVAIVNNDCPYSKQMVQKCRGKILTYGIDTSSDLMAKKIQLSPNGTSCTICYQGQEVPFSWPLCGRFNVSNVLACLALGLTINIPLSSLKSFMETIAPPPGRLEPVPNDKGISIYVDFAHSPDALKKVLECLTEMKKGKIFVVFGCGGDRDKTKRPLMARVCEEMADLCIVTSDNPRTEDPEAIINDIIKGFTNKNSYIIEMDRADAIGRAIELALPNDIVLIAGKGHEPYQILGHQTVEFDDRIHAKEKIDAY
jgi:UDP-N-acetylmuramoyl-L-alanyl-D-glutamate--2,6-diaminopimelate ligase